MQTYILLHEAYSVRLRCGGVRSCKASDIGNSRKDIIPLADTYAVSYTHSEPTSTIRFYIILKPSFQTVRPHLRLSTIHFYIILKPRFFKPAETICLSTIHFYIILKLIGLWACQLFGLSTIHFYIILKPF